MVVEAVGGLLTNSLALLSDAGHMFSDAVSLGIALLAIIFAARVANGSKTYGYKRLEILAATLNGLTLIIIALFIFYEAIGRFLNPPEIASIGMLVVSSIGLVVNIVVAWIMVLGADTKENLNMRGAYLHVISDMIGSIAAIIAALLILFFEWGWADPLASIFVAVLVLRSGYHLTKASLHILMEGTPQEINVDEMIHTIQKYEEINAIHDLHVWTITSGLNALTCHVVVNENLTLKESEQLLAKIEHDLLHQNIHHVTIQVETKTHKHEHSIYCTVKQDTNPHHHHHH